MTGDNIKSANGSRESDATVIDRICDRFETAWRRGNPPDIEAYLGTIPEPLRSKLFSELLISDLECRFRTGESIDVAVYAASFPDRSAQINAIVSEYRKSKPGDVERRWETVDSSRKEPAVPQSDGPRKCGQYRLLSEIARGGMGIVFRAHDTKLQRVVALKMILDRNLASEQAVQRFYEEAEAAAGLDHAGIVPVFDVGKQDGHHYYAMGLVEGPTLAEELQNRPFSMRESSQMVADIADAVHYAHENGVVHRDLKPGNILLTADGQPRITDFGLAKRTDRPSQLTMAGQILGTPGYMAPEQAAGGSDQAGPAVDVYALGAILYHLLTGHPPFRTELDALVRVLEQDPVPPRVLNRRVPRDLNTICMKCLSKDPAHRYESAQQLADDLRRYLDAEPIQARPLGYHQQVLRWARHRPKLAMTWATMLAFYVYHLYCYAIGVEASMGTFHWITTGTVLAVCGYSWFYQQLLLRPDTRSWILYAWAGTDILMFTVFMITAVDGPHSPLVVIYYCLVASAALTFSKRMVGTLTVGVLLSYGLLVLASRWWLPPTATFDETVPFTIGLIAIGLIQYFVLRCVRLQMPTL